MAKDDLSKLPKDDLIEMIENDLTKMRFDYAWKHFDFHAKQRVTMFNFFLVIVGIFANAIVAAIEISLSTPVLVTLCISGLVMALAFLCLDIRNTDLLENSEDILRKIEAEELFNNYKGTAKRSWNTPIQLGLLHREREEQIARVEKDEWFRRPNLVKHKFWIRGVEAAVIVLFALVGLVAFFSPELIQPCGLPGLID